jgi:hypothetical protein
MSPHPEYPLESGVHSRIQLEAHQIDANERMAIKSMESESQLRGRRYLFILAAIALSGAIALAFIYFGAKDILIDVLKLALAFGAGAISGLHWSRQNK